MLSKIHQVERVKGLSDRGTWAKELLSGKEPDLTGSKKFVEALYFEAEHLGRDQIHFPS